ncbi:hypothetical protein BDW62DRAFT_122765 [Aspergillus aurantiobrunneus]
MKFYYQILTTPTADTPGTALLLHFPGKRYIFGHVSEGSQRACTENGTKLATLSDIFLSGRMGWDNTGGLVGMILTKADTVASSVAAHEALWREKVANRQKRSGGTAEVQKAPKKEPEEEHHDLTLHGSRNLAHTMATARRFVFRKGLPVYTKEYDTDSISRKLNNKSSDPFEEPTWSDENVKVWAMPVTPSSATPRPQSPRKRRLDEFREDAPSLVRVDQQTLDQAIRQAVVSHMFDSNWTLDTLEETRLADVNMPAQIFVRNPATKDLEKYTGPLPGGDVAVPEMKVLVRKPWPGAAVEKIPTTTKCDESLCYILRNHDMRGKFDPMKAMALGIKPGPAFGMLTKGESVTCDDGKVVTPNMVIGAGRPGKGLAVLDLPTPEYVESLINRPEWKSPTVMSNLKVFLWILGPGVGDHPRLREFVAARPDCEHIVSSTDYCPNYLTMQSAAGSAIRMARIRPDNYQSPIHDNLRVPQTRSSIEDPLPAETIESPFRTAEPGMIVSMEPELEINSSEVVPRLNTASILEKMPVSAEMRAKTITRRLEKRKHQEKQEQFLKDLPGANAEIITLGTGSSAPSKYRNVSSTLIHVPDKGYYLLDCGEGTLGQLKRMFKPEKLSEVLRNLHLVWISHLHADHHLGTVSIIKAWYRENYPGGVPYSNQVEGNLQEALVDKRLVLVSDKMMVEWLEEYAGVEDFGFAKLTPLCAFPYKEGGEIKTKFVYRHCRADGSYPGREAAESRPFQTDVYFTQRNKKLTRLLCEATGLRDLLTTYVPHCRAAMAVSLVFDDGFKVSFSGDCRPSPSFAQIGKDSTVLIHEATFNDDMAGSAIAKKHSTVSEAIEVGRQMRARAILLTHFSQRYQKIAVLDQPQSNRASRDQPQVQHPAETTAPDIPLDSDTDEDLTVNPPVAPNTPEPEKPQPAVVPIVGSADLMRVRVRDMYKLEAYYPATEKLFEVIDRAATQEADKARTGKNETMKAKKEKVAKKKQRNIDEAKEEKKEKTNAKTSPSERSHPGSPQSSHQPPVVSVWDAPESESGWSTSEPETDSAAASR